MNNLNDLEYRVCICEPLHYSDWPTYREACKRAAASVTWVEVEAGETIRAALSRHMKDAIDIRNDYYRSRVDDWRVVHG